MNMIIKKLDYRNMGEGSFNASCVIQVIEKSKNDLNQPLIQHLGHSTENKNADLSQRIINPTVLNLGRT